MATKFPSYDLSNMDKAELIFEKRLAFCIHCRSCEAVCPQQIKISEVLADFEKRLDPA